MTRQMCSVSRRTDISPFPFFLADILQNYLHFYSAVFTYWRVKDVRVDDALRCGAASVLLLPQLRVYLQRVTLMQRNDYFYSAALGRPRRLWVELLPIGPLITSVSAATPGSFSATAAAPWQAPPPQSAHKRPLLPPPGSAPLLPFLTPLLLQLVLDGLKH